MVIYGNNLHEKLVGIAISKNYIKYATPFCDFVDDPELAPDIDLAVNFNQAINGNPIAAQMFMDTIILSGSKFDWATKEFYRDRMTSNRKVWGGLIFNVEVGFQTNAFKDALKDCLNSPCNLFAKSSDTVARLAQVASTKNGSNSFGIGDLSATFINITNGLDEAVTKKLPTIFGNAALELTQNIKTARTNVDEVVAGKKNLRELTSLANASGSMRGTNKIYRYTPDLKSYTDYTNVGNNILLKVKQKLGGCFERFEGAYRYNPFEDDTSVPASNQKQQYNGKEVETEANGVVKRKKSLGARLLNFLSFGWFDSDDGDGDPPGEFDDPLGEDRDWQDIGPMDGFGNYHEDWIGDDGNVIPPDKRPGYMSKKGDQKAQANFLKKATSQQLNAEHKAQETDKVRERKQYTAGAVNSYEPYIPGVSPKSYQPEGIKDLPPVGDPVGGILTEAQRAAAQRYNNRN